MIQLVKTSPTVPGMPLCRRDPARQDHPYLVCHYGGMIQLAGHHGQLLANSPPSNFLILKHKRTNVYTSFNLSLLTASIPVLIFKRTNKGTLNFCDFFLFQIKQSMNKQQSSKEMQANFQKIGGTPLDISSVFFVLVSGRIACTNAD